MTLVRVGKHTVSISSNGKTQTTTSITNDTTINLNLSPEDVTNTTDLNFSKNYESDGFISRNDEFPSNRGIYVSYIDYFASADGKNSGTGNPNSNIRFRAFAPDGSTLIDDSQSDTGSIVSSASISNNVYVGGRIDRCRINGSADGLVDETQDIDYNVTITTLE